MKKLNVVMFAACILCGLLVYSAAIRAVINRYELPRRVKLISRSEKIIRVYDASATVKDSELLIRDAVLVEETDVSRYVE